MKNRFLCSDPESAKCNDLKNEDKFKAKFFSSDLIPFDDIQKWYKKFPKTTFNDYIMGVLSIGVKRWLKQNWIEDTSKILMLIPINMRGLPNSIKELKIGNYIVALRVELKLWNKLSEAISCAQAEIKHRIKPIVLMIANSFTYFMKLINISIT